MEFQTTPVNSDATWNTYAIQLYSNLNPVPQPCLNAGRLGTNAAVYDNTNPSGSDCAQIGPDMNQPQTPPTLTAQSNGVLFRFQYQDPTTGANSMLLTLTCGTGRGNPGQIAAADIGGGWTYSTTWPTSAACKPGQSPGGDLEEGGVFAVAFLCVFFIGGGAYLAGGYYYNTRTRGYSGTEALPNIAFWRTIPSLVKDGVGYSSAFVKSKIDGTEFTPPETTRTAAAPSADFEPMKAAPRESPRNTKQSKASAKALVADAQAIVVASPKKKKKKKPAAAAEEEEEEEEDVRRTSTGGSGKKKKKKAAAAAQSNDPVKKKKKKKKPVYEAVEDDDAKE